METEQAHSGRMLPGGGDAALRRPWTAQRAVPTGYKPVVWLNLVCLDAPFVSVVWLWLFATTFHVSLEPVNCAALFLTAWSIYLADRLADSCSLPADGPRSLRHRFCLEHRQIWIAGLTMIAAADAILIWNCIGPSTFFAGAFVGILALIHLVLNYSLGGAWPPLPLKELAIGSLFAAGTLLPLFPVRAPITDSLGFSVVAFGMLCTLNCLGIAFWERELDETQRKVSFATRYPDLDRHLRKPSIALALGSAVTAIIHGEAAPILSCVSVSSLLLALLDFFRGRIAPDQRTALADIVLLTPLPALFVMNV